MTRAAFVHPDLAREPFTLTQAREVGVDLWHLRRRHVWRRLAPEVYASSHLGDAPLVKLRGALLRAPGGVFSGLTAAWLHGLPAKPCEPIEMTLAPGAPVAGRAGMRIRRATLSGKQVVSRQGLEVTAVERTLADLSGVLALTEVMVLADAAAHARLTTRSKLAAAAKAAVGRPGVIAFRKVVALVEPAIESPMESRMRMRFIVAGLQVPLAQHVLVDEHGEFLARVDFYYPDARLAIEYDGATHKTSLAEDNRRQNRLTEAGVRLLRFTAADVYDRADAMVAEVRGMLLARSR